MNDPTNKSIEQLANAFLEQWHQTALPTLDAVDMLDLVDYFANKGMEFEADLCHYIVNRNYPDDPEVSLAQAHNLAEQGNWQESAKTRMQSGVAGYDEQIFKVEQLIRSYQYQQAMDLMLQSLPREGHRDLPDYDFIFDTACLFYDNGYNAQAIQAFSMLPPNYVDYRSAQLHIVDANAFLGHFSEAKKLLNKMLDRDAFNAELWERMANYSYHNGDYNDLAEAKDYAMAINPESSAWRFNTLAAVRERAVADTGALLDELKEHQEYLCLKEYADTVYEAGLYDRALVAYAWASLYCPNGDNLRIYLQSQYILCLAHQDESEQAYTLLQSLTTFYGEFWDIVYEAAQISLEHQRVDWGIKYLDLARQKHYIKATRLNQLAALLAHYDLYATAAHLWQDILAHKSLLSPSYQHYADTALEKL